MDMFDRMNAATMRAHETVSDPTNASGYRTYTPSFNALNEETRRYNNERRGMSFTSCNNDRY